IEHPLDLFYRPTEPLKNSRRVSGERGDSKTTPLRKRIRFAAERLESQLLLGLLVLLAVFLACAFSQVQCEGLHASNALHEPRKTETRHPHRAPSCREIQVHQIGSRKRPLLENELLALELNTK